MRRELTWAIVAAGALSVGAFAAEPYARALIPYYVAASRVIARGHPWDVASVDISRTSGPGAVLRLTGFIRRRLTDPQPVARVVSRLQVAAVVESPVVFWTLVALWPMGSVRRRFGVLLLGLPVFMALETATTVCQLLNPLAYGSAVLAGNSSPLTGWERWSRFVEGGGRVALAVAAAILTVAAIQRLRKGAASGSPMNSPCPGIATLFQYASTSVSPAR